MKHLLLLVILMQVVLFPVLSHGKLYTKPVVIADDDYNDNNTRQKHTDSLLQILNISNLHDTNKVKVLNEIGESLWYNQPDTAKLYHLRALHLAKARNYIKGMTSTYFDLGYVYRTQYETDSAIACFSAGLELARQHRDTSNMGFAVNCLAMDYASLGEHRNAIDYYRRSAWLYNAIGDTVSAATALGNAGAEYIKLRQYDSAIICIRQAADIYLQSGRLNGFGIETMLLARVYEAQQDKKMALKTYQQALQYMESPYANKFIGVTYLDAAVLLAEMGNVKESISYVQRGIELLQEGNFLREIYTAYRKAATVYELAGNYKQSLLYYKLSTIFHDSIAAKERGTKIAKALNKAESERKNREIAELQNERKIRNLYQVFLLIMFGVAAVMVILLGSRYKVKRNAAYRLTLLNAELQDEIRQRIVLEDQLHMMNQSLEKQVAMRTKELVYAEIDKKNALIELQEQKSMSWRMIAEAQERERQRIAQDLHDGIGLEFAIIKTRLSRIADDYQGQLIPTVEEQLSDILIQVDKGIQNIRFISHQLMPYALQSLGLAAAIQSLFYTLQSSSTMKVEIELHGMEGARFDALIEISLYRILQEIVSNILKHSHATLLHVEANYFDGNLFLSVKDNGIGFAMDSSTMNGIGFISMKNRAFLIGAEISIHSKPGQGTVISLEVQTPLQSLRKPYNPAHKKV